MEKRSVLWMQNLINWFMHVRTPWKRNSTEATVSTLPHLLMLRERMRKSAVMMLLCNFEETSDKQCYPLKKQTKKKKTQVKGHVCILTGNSMAIIKVTSKHLSHYYYFARCFP